MRKSLIFVAAFMICVSGANAQVKPFNLYAGIGTTIPSAPLDFKDKSKKGFHATAGLGFTIGPSLELVAKGSIHGLKRNWDNEPDPTSLAGGELKATMLGVDIRLTPSLPAAPIKPFLFGGIGLALMSPDEIKVTGGTTVEQLVADQNKAYYNLGGGLEFMRGPLFSLYIEASFVSIGTSGEPTQWVPITVGLKF